MRGPDFFLVGAPKCGTTAMDSYLAGHPQVFMCPRKESHYFATDLRRHFGTTYTLDQYLQLFRGAEAPEVLRVGEASVWYLYSHTAAAEIERFNPRADIVIMLRNPVDMVHSFHSHSVYMGREPIANFEEAISVDDDREAGRTKRHFVPRSYRSAVRYADQVQRFLARFGPERVHIVLYEEFARDPGAEYRRLCRSLGLVDQYTPDFEVINASRRVRSPRVRALTQSPPAPLRSALRLVSTRRLRSRLFAGLVRANATPNPRAPMTDRCRRQLEREYGPEIERLSDLLDRDLSLWSGVESGRPEPQPDAMVRAAPRSAD
jgi:hypothetical protein